jgi:GT2 family glycosyltransferase
MPDAGVPYWDSLFVNGGAILVRREVLEAVRIGPQSYLDERLYLYWEEVAFCHAAWDKGFRCQIVRAATVRHKVERTASGYQSPIWYYYSGRNRVLLSKELLSPPWRALFHLIHIPLRFASVAKHRYACARAVLWGMADGYRGVAGKWKYHDEVTKDYGQN